MRTVSIGLSGDSKLINNRFNPKIVVGDRPGNGKRIKSTGKEMLRLLKQEDAG